MTDEIPEIIDRSRVDAYAAARRRSMLMHAAWRPMLAGAVGAALMMGCVWIILPKVSTREIIVPAITMKETEVPKVTMRDVTADHVVRKDIEVEVPKVTMRNVEVPNIVLVPRDVLVDHVVPHDVPVEIPRVVVAPVAEAPPLTAPELRFVSAPEYQDAPYRGRVVMSRGGGALSFAGGRDFFPAHRDPATSQLVRDQDRAFDTDGVIGDLARCRQDPVDGLWSCVALHRGREIPIMHRQGHPA